MQTGDEFVKTGFSLALLIGMMFVFSDVRFTEYVYAQQLEETYDVIVLGGEPEGVAAALSAARNGAKTLLIEHRDGLGGLMTYGMLNFIDMVQGQGGKNVVGGIFREWHNMVGGASAFHIEKAKESFMKLVKDEPNITLLLNTEIVDAVLADDGKTVIGVKLKNATVYGKYFIDATQDADFAVMAGAPYFIGSEDIQLKDRRMSVTPIIHLKDVNWNGVKKAAQEGTFGEAEVRDHVAWGFNELHYTYKPVEENVRLRGLNLVQIVNDDGSRDYYINALQIFGVDGLDPKSREDALEKGKRETEHILKYLQENFPGFEQAQIASYPTELYVRETRHIKAEYMLPMSDVWTNRDHWDGIAMGGYPVDVQATSINDYGYVLANPTQYAIPFRSLVPLDIENTLVVGRSSGYSSLAAGSARVIPTGMATGEAGGLAAVIALENGLTFRELSKNESLIKQLRERLTRQGAIVESFQLDYPYQGEWFDEAIQLLINDGLVIGGYQNDLHVDRDMTLNHFINMLTNGIKRKMTESKKQKEQLNTLFHYSKQGEEVATRDEVAQLLFLVFANELVPKDVAWKRAYEEQWIDEQLYHRIQEDRPLSRKEGYYLVANLLKTIGSTKNFGTSFFKLGLNETRTNLHQFRTINCLSSTIMGKTRTLIFEFRTFYLKSRTKTLVN